MAACGGKPKKDEEAKEDSSEDLKTFVSTWSKYLKSKKVSTIVDEDKTPITILPDASLDEAMKTLKDKNVKSAPVIDKEGKAIGLLDLSSIMKYQIREKKKLLGEDVVSANSAMPKEERANDVSYLARMRRYKTVSSDATLLELAQALNNVPAVGVVNSKKELVAVVSQGKLAKAVVKSECLKDLKLTVGGLFNEKKTPGKVDSALNTESLLNVFEVMGKKNRSSFAIVDKDNCFVGAVDITDTDKFSKMNDAKNTTAGDYITNSQSNKALNCGSDMTVVEALGRICSKKSHRIFVIEDKKLQTVCALTDVIKLVSLAE